MKIKKTKEYNEIFEFLTKAEMEARNGNFMTCGTWCKNAMELSFKFGNNENLNKKLGPILNGNILLTKENTKLYKRK